MTVTELMRRIARAQATPTLYLLGKGGFYGNEAGPHDMPGTPVVPADELRTMKKEERKKYDVYVASAQAARIDLAALPESMPACDCSGFVLWALDMARAPARAGLGAWINTDAIHADAMGAETLFERDDSGSRPLKTRIGAMLVYPKGDGHEVGHIGVVTGVDGADGTGVPTRVVHCSSENFLLPPVAGTERTAILETAPDVFLEAGRTIAVWRKGMER